MERHTKKYYLFNKIRQKLKIYQILLSFVQTKMFKSKRHQKKLRKLPKHIQPLKEEKLIFEIKRFH